MSRYLGRLFISTGLVVFQPEGRANALWNTQPAEPIVHRDRALTVVVGRLRPPWMNSGLVLVGAGPERKVGVVLLTRWQGRAVAEAAGAVGFEVVVYETWLSAGGGIGSQSELERFRHGHEAARP